VLSCPRSRSTDPRDYWVASSQGIPVLATPYVTASGIVLPIELAAADRHVSTTVVWSQWDQHGTVAAPLGVLPISVLADRQAAPAGARRHRPASDAPPDGVDRPPITWPRPAAIAALAGFVDALGSRGYGRQDELGCLGPRAPPVDEADGMHVGGIRRRGTGYRL